MSNTVATAAWPARSATSSASTPFMIHSEISVWRRSCTRSRLSSPSYDSIKLAFRAAFLKTRREELRRFRCVPAPVSRSASDSAPSPGPFTRPAALIRSPKLRPSNVVPAIAPRSPSLCGLGLHKSSASANGVGPRHSVVADHAALVPCSSMSPPRCQSPGAACGPPRATCRT